MSRFYFALLIFLQLLCLPLESVAQSGEKVAAPGTATIAGQVRLNGEPLPSVTVALRPERMTIPPGPESVHQTQSDANGNYRIAGIVAGAYILSVPDTEFLLVGGTAAGLRGKTLNLAAGESLENIDLEFRRGGVITGRVTDATGRPLVREQIELTKLKEDGQPQPSPFNHPGLKLTDEHGIYRISGLPEGRYLIGVGTSQKEREGKRPVNYSDYAKTYHPSVTDPSQAKVVVVSVGSETREVNISVAAAKGTYEIHGRVVSAETGEPMGGMGILYRPVRQEERILSEWMPSRERTNAAGEFQITGLLPGKYALAVRSNDEGEFISRPLVCEVVASTIEGIKLTLERGGSMSGVLVLEGIDDPNVLVKLAQNHIFGNNKAQQFLLPPREPTKINADGSFLIKGLAPGKINLSLVINPKLGGFWIKRIERDGTLQSDGVEVNANEGLSKLRVVVGYSNLTLRGEVQVLGGKLPPHQGIYVNANRVDDAAPSARAQVDARGQFLLENLLPGEYELRLVSLIFQPGEPRDPQFLKLMASIRQKVMVGREPQPTVTLVIDLGQKESRLNACPIAETPACRAVERYAVIPRRLRRRR